jgi:hypothetical protein
MNRDQPEAALFHLDDEKLLGEPGIRTALALAKSPRAKRCRVLPRSHGESQKAGSNVSGIRVASRCFPRSLPVKTATLNVALGKQASD